MRLVRVEEIPEVVNHTPKKQVSGMLSDFMASDMKYAKVEIADGEYTRIEYARQSLLQVCARHGYRVDVKTRNGEIYLAKKEA